MTGRELFRKIMDRLDADWEEVQVHPYWRARPGYFESFVMTSLDDLTLDQLKEMLDHDEEINDCVISKDFLDLLPPFFGMTQDDFRRMVEAE